MAILRRDCGGRPRRLHLPLVSVKFLASRDSSPTNLSATRRRGQGRPIAEQLFAAADGSFSSAGVTITAALFGLVFACALGAAMWLVMRQRGKVRDHRPWVVC